MQDSGTAIRNAAANVRVLLIEARGGALGVAADHAAIDGRRVAAADGRSVGYGELAAAPSLHVAARPTSPLPRRPRTRMIGQTCRGSTSPPR